jgi:hypothetical protein
MVTRIARSFSSKRMDPVGEALIARYGDGAFRSRVRPHAQAVACSILAADHDPLHAAMMLQIVQAIEEGGIACLSEDSIQP